MSNIDGFEDEMDDEMDLPEDDESEGSMIDMEEEDSDMEETEDGGVYVSMGNLIEENPEFYSNIAENINDSNMEFMAQDLLDAIERDKESRKLRDKQYEEGLKRTGLGNDAPGGAQFQGASRVVHPILTEVSVDFASRAIKELFPRSGADGGPVKDQIIGKPTQEKVDKARRKTRYFNWQLTQQMPEFRSELEQLLTQIPLGGAAYLKMNWDRRLRRPRGYFIPIDEIYLPYSATSFATSERVTHAQKVTQIEFDRRVLNGLYRDINLIPGEIPDESKAEKANNKIEGREQNDYYDEDGLRQIYEIYCEAEIPEDKYTKGEIAPYIITIDATSKRVLAIYRNWDEMDERRIGLEWIIEFPFVPWRGAYPIGITHMIGTLSGAMTGALRALLDAAHIQNSQTGLKLKGGSRGGQSLNIQPTQVIEIEGTPNGDDIRKTFMPLPFNGPSPVLYQLLGFLTETSKNVVRTTFEDLSDNPNRMPVGTTLALIEQGMTVFNSIHARLHDAMGRMLKVLHRLNKMYLEDEEIYDEFGELLVKRSDFDGPMDVIPVSDPNIFSDMQRYAQIEVIASRAQAMPQLYDVRAVEEMILERTKIPNAAKKLLVPIPQPQRLNAVNENVAAVMGTPIVAFPDQDHLAHIKTHLNFMMNPVLGANPIISPVFTPAILTHIKDHIALWYVNEVVKIGSDAAGVDLSILMEPDNPEIDREFDKTLAAASDFVNMEAQRTFAKLPEIIQKAVEHLQSLNKPPLSPEQVAMMAAQNQQAETQRKAQADQVDAALKQQKIAADQQAKMAELAAKAEMNREDNQTAMLISASEISAGKRTNLKTGTGLGR